MKICIEGQALLSPRTGVARYVDGLVRGLARLALGMDITVSYFSPPRSLRGTRLFPHCTGVSEKVIGFLPGSYIQRLWEFFWKPATDFLVGPHDLFHFTNFTAAPVKDGPSLVTIHDTTFIRYPQFVERNNKLKLKRLMNRTLESVAAVIAVSESTKREVQELLGFPGERIFVTHLGIEKRFGPAPTPAELAAVRHKYGLENPFLLFVGTLEPRKNLPLLIRAFSILARTGGHYLVIVGRRGWLARETLRALETAPCKDRIRYLGYVPESDLPLLYAAADLFVFPSYYEGFGFTPLEAMRCGTPVLSSDRGSLKEVLGDAACLFNPCETRPEDLAEMIAELLEDKGRLKRLAATGEAFSRRYTWEETVAQTLDVYRLHLPPAYGLPLGK